MRLFHGSDTKFAALEPQHGARRGSHEDERFVGVAGVWLHDQPDALMTPGGQSAPFRYLHEVELNEHDPDLEEDQRQAEAISYMRRSPLFESKDVDLMPRFFFLKRGVAVRAVREWESATQTYR
jgi:hypothetical protein